MLFRSWVDGMNEQNPSTFEEGKHGRLYVADHSFADDVSTFPYKDTGICPCFGTGYISAFGYSEEFDWLFVPTEKAGNSALPVGDFFWNQNPGWKVALLGACWDSRADAGAFYLHLNGASADRSRHLGGRLVYVPSKATA